MVSVAQFKKIIILSLIFSVFACESTNRRDVKEEVDIYAALKNDDIEYHQEERVITKHSPEYLVNGINELRALFFRREFESLTDLGIRLIKLSPSLTEAYYWMARVEMEKSEFQRAYDMAEKGLSVVEDPNMKRELERVKGQAQMGAQQTPEY